MTSAVYINPLFDVTPIITFHSIIKFIFIDNSPDIMLKDKSEKKFIDNLCDTYKNINFSLQGMATNYLKFRNKNRTIEYFYNTAFNPYTNEIIKNKIKECDTLIDIGYHPDKYILEFLPKHFNLIVSTKQIGNNRYNNNLFSDSNSKEELKQRTNKIFLMVDNYNFDYKFDTEDCLDYIELYDLDKMIRLSDDLKFI